MEFKDLSPFIYDMGYGAFAGFIIGFTMKRIFKFLVIITGLYLLSLIWLSGKGFISVNWGTFFEFLNGSFKSVDIAVKNITKTLAFSGSFIGGFILGLRV